MAARSATGVETNTDPSNCGGCGHGWLDDQDQQNTRCSLGQCAPSCGTRTGCTCAQPIAQAQIEALCQQTQNMDPATGWMWCNPTAQMCNFAASGPTCASYDVNTKQWLCGVCQPGSPPSCDVTNPTPCPCARR